MTEEQIRAFFAHIAEVKERWNRDRIGHVSGDHVAIDDDEGGIEFLYSSYGDSDRDTIPMLAFVDYDAGVALYRQQRQEQQRKWEEDAERRNREQYEKLKQKYG